MGYTQTERFQVHCEDGSINKGEKESKMQVLMRSGAAARGGEEGGGAMGDGGVLAWWGWDASKGGMIPGKILDPPQDPMSGPCTSG